MYVHGSNKNVEYKKPDHNFYKGIVIDNLDPKKILRVKVFIPELSNQPEPVLAEKEPKEVRYPNSQVPGIEQKQVDTLRELLPWAEQCAPLMGEAGLSRYFAPDGTQTGKGNQPQNTNAKRNKTPSIKEGGAIPRMLSQVVTPGHRYIAGSIADSGLLPDAVTDVLDAWADGGYGKQNTTGNSYSAKNSGPLASGAYGVPQVGAHVWVFHDKGDLNFPVYFGVAPSYRETGMVYQDGGYPNSGYEVNYGGVIPEGDLEYTSTPGSGSGSGSAAVNVAKPVTPGTGTRSATGTGSDVNLTGLDSRWDSIIKRAREKGGDFRITSGYRSNAEQDRLYAQGRTTPGNIVTNARGGQSKHNTGRAIDIVWTGGTGINDRQPTGTLYDPVQLRRNARLIQEAASELGYEVEWGGDWTSFVDTPHLQIKG